jgi:sugar phosphate isomerase/epimerase
MAAAGASGLSNSAAGAASDPSDIKLSVATYSFREFQRDLAIKMIKQLNVEYCDVKEFHLPYNDTPKELAAGRKKFDAAGLKVVGGGNISLQKDDEADLRRYFDYAKACSFPMMIIAPTHETLPKIEKLAIEYNMRIALHNHGPEDKHFPTAESALEAMKGMDPRMGLCLDLGHEARTGKDVVEAIANAGTRLHEIHMKDLADFKEKASQVPVGDGIMPVPAIFRQLRKVNYPGVVSLEYEIDADNPLPGMQKSFSYMRGVIAGQRS